MQVLRIVNGLFIAYETMILLWALMSWFPQAQESSLARWLNRLVSPYVEVFERFIPSLGGLSFAALVGVWVLNLAHTFVLRNLAQLLGVR